MRKNKRFCLHDARGKIWVVDDLWARRCPPWPNRSAVAERHSIYTMIQTLSRSASIIQQAVFLVFNRTGDGTGVCLGVWGPVGLFWSRNGKPHSCKWLEALTVQTRMTRRLSCEDLHCSIFIFLKLSTLSGQGATVGSLNRGLIVVLPAQRLNGEFCEHAVFFVCFLCMIKLATRDWEIETLQERVVAPMCAF